MVAAAERSDEFHAPMLGSRSESKDKLKFMKEGSTEEGGEGASDSSVQRDEIERVASAGQGNGVSSESQGRRSLAVAPATELSATTFPTNPSPDATGTQSAKKPDCDEGAKKPSAVLNCFQSPREQDDDEDARKPSADRCDFHTWKEEDEEEAKKKSLNERKRCREKQRRLDTNSQFTALAAILREIETDDFVEEVQDNLNKWDEFSGTNAQGKMDASSTSGSLSTESSAMENASKKLKSDTSSQSSFRGAAASNATGAPGTFNPSNRVDLIARTIAMLTQFRVIRKSRREELRDVRRQNAEIRKEVEELRRLVAHYKTLGMGQAKPQDKVRLMLLLQCVFHRPLAISHFPFFHSDS